MIHVVLQSQEQVYKLVHVLMDDEKVAHELWHEGMPYHGDLWLHSKNYVDAFDDLFLRGTVIALSSDRTFLGEARIKLRDVTIIEGESTNQLKKILRFIGHEDR